jgi:hypothetical protein
MKKTLVLAAVLLGSAAVSSVLAQGQVRWGNNFTGVTRAPIFGVEATGDAARVIRGNNAAGLPVGTSVYTGALLQGTGFTIAMFFGNDTTPRGVNTFRTGAAAGLTTLLTVTDDTRPPGTSGFNVQFRAWDNRGGQITSWSQVMADPSIPQGVSDPFTIGALGGVNGPNVFPVPDTTGIRSFNLTQVVPEPSLIALGALGLGALLLRRRK